MSNNLTVMTDNIVENGSAVAAAAAGQPGWQDGFCERYAGILLAYGRWFLLAALIIGSIGAIVMVVNSLKQPGDQDGKPGKLGSSALQSAVAAVTALVEAFSKAPTWLAMLGGGVLLLWMAGNTPQTCNCPEGATACAVDTNSSGGTENVSGNAVGTASDDAGDNESGGGNSNS